MRTARWAVTQRSTKGTPWAKSGVDPSSMPWLAARAGTPRVTASRAAPTVPDTPARGPMFWPKLIPDTTRSGRKDRPWWATAQITVSAG